MKPFLKNKTFITLLILLNANHTQAKRDLPGSDFLVIGGIAAVTGAVAVYKLYYNSDYYNKSVIESAFKSFNKSLNYNPEIELLKNKFNLKAMTDSDKRAVVGRISEDVAYDLADTILHCGIDKYLYELGSTLRSLKYHRSCLYDVVRKKTNLHNDGTKLITAISDSIPNLEFLQMYLTNHKDYFKLYELGDEIHKRFKNDLNVLMSNIEPGVIQDLKEHVLVKNYNQEYPYLTYVDSLTYAINKLESFRSPIVYRELQHNVKSLKDKLTKIKNYIITDKDYLNEKRKRSEDSQRREKDRIEQAIKARELQLKEQKLAEERMFRERELAIKEREAKAKEDKALASKNQNLQPVAPNININIENIR